MVVAKTRNKDDALGSRRRSTSRRTARPAVARSPCACSCTPCTAARASGCQIRFGRGAPSAARGASGTRCPSCRGKPPFGSGSSSCPSRAGRAVSGRRPGSTRPTRAGAVAAGPRPRVRPSPGRLSGSGEGAPRRGRRLASVSRRRLWKGRHRSRRAAGGSGSRTWQRLLVQGTLGCVGTAGDSAPGSGRA